MFVFTCSPFLMMLLYITVKFCQNMTHVPGDTMTFLFFSDLATLILPSSLGLERVLLVILVSAVET